MGYCEHPTSKYMAAFIFWVLDVGHLKRKYFLYAITRELLIKQCSTILIHGYCDVMSKKKT